MQLNGFKCKMQLNAIKWILSEEGSTYTDLAYFKKCRELELLPLKFRLDFFAILLSIELFMKLSLLNCRNT